MYITTIKRWEQVRLSYKIINQVLIFFDCDNQVYIIRTMSGVVVVNVKHVTQEISTQYFHRNFVPENEMCHHSLVELQVCSVICRWNGVMSIHCTTLHLSFTVILETEFFASEEAVDFGSCNRVKHLRGKKMNGMYGVIVQQYYSTNVRNLKILHQHIQQDVIQESIT